MNILMLTAAVRGSVSSPGIYGDSCAMFLFLSGAVSLGIAVYLLYKSPKAQAARYYTRARY
jgi:hypothetical protein